MSVEKEIREFLARPENLPTALEIERYVGKMRRSYHAAFWPAIEEELEERLDSSPHNIRWYVARGSRPYQKAHAARKLLPKPAMPSPNSSRLGIRFGQGTPGNDFRLRYGIRWCGGGSRRQDLPEYQSLRSYLLERKVQVNEDSSWLTFAHTGYSVGGDRFMLRIASELELFVSELVDLPWTLFEETVDLLNAFNEAVAKDNPMDSSRMAG